MKAGELRKKTEEELQQELINLRKEQFNLRIQAATAQLAGTHQFRQIRQNIARIKTVLNQKKQNASVQESPL